MCKHEPEGYLGMSGLLKYIGIFFLVVLFVGTGQLLVAQVGRQHLWQMFWLGFIIWVWGYIILIRIRDKEKMAQDIERLKNPMLAKQKQELEKIKVAAISALISITFFYFSVSLIFKDDILLSGVVLAITFWVSVQLQNKILRRDKED